MGLWGPETCKTEPDMKSCTVAYFVVIEKKNRTKREVQLWRQPSVTGCCNWNSDKERRNTVSVERERIFLNTVKNKNNEPASTLLLLVLCMTWVIYNKKFRAKLNIQQKVAEWLITYIVTAAYRDKSPASRIGLFENFRTSDGAVFKQCYCAVLTDETSSRRWRLRVRHSILPDSSISSRWSTIITQHHLSASASAAMCTYLQ